MQKDSDAGTCDEESNTSTSDEESDVHNRKTWDWEATRARIENFEPRPPPTPKGKNLTKEEQRQLNMELDSIPTRKCIQELRIQITFGPQAQFGFEICPVPDHEYWKREMNEDTYDWEYRPYLSGYDIPPATWFEDANLEDGDLEDGDLEEKDH